MCMRMYRYVASWLGWQIRLFARDNSAKSAEGKAWHCSSGGTTKRDMRDSCVRRPTRARDSTDLGTSKSPASGCQSAGETVVIICLK